MRGVEMFVVIANWPRARGEHWPLLLKARAVENQAYVVGVNRTGEDPKLSFGGGSLVIDPYGNTIAEGGEDPEVISATIDREEVERWRTVFPVLNDIRQDLIDKK